MAKKYIDAEAALEAIEEVAIVNFELDSEFYHESMASVRAIPAADVVEVIHAHWINDGIIHCSRCNAYLEEDEMTNHTMKYCYYCGAKMDEEIDE